MTCIFHLSLIMWMSLLANLSFTIIFPRLTASHLTPLACFRAGNSPYWEGPHPGVLEWILNQPPLFALDGITKIAHCQLTPALFKKLLAHPHFTPALLFQWTPMAHTLVGDTLHDWSMQERLEALDPGRGQATCAFQFPLHTAAKKLPLEPGCIPIFKLLHDNGARWTGKGGLYWNHYTTHCSWCQIR